MNIANVLGASENDRFFALPLEAFEKTAVLEDEPAPSGVGRERTGARRALLDIFFLLLAAGAVGGYMFFSGRLDDLTQLLVRQLY